MKRVVIYGASESGQKIMRELELTPYSPGTEKPYKILAFVDGNKNLWNKKIEGVEVISPDNLQTLDYDMVVIAALMESARTEIYGFLRDTLKVEKEKICTEYIESFVKARYRFLLDQSSIIYQKNIEGSVAEVGVWRGDYAKYINAFFPDRTLYLFDTFSWYDSRDIEADQKEGIAGTLLSNKDIFRDTSVEYVQSVLPHPEKAVFKVGYFPDTAQDIDDKFVFVNLDVNLYTTTLAALEYFYPKMQKGGVILCHDYFSWDVDPGSSIAINEFANKYNISYIAIGDRLSVAFVKQ